jgi:pSer/pThr/pTyr-binding forkhead associated (FHA) protein
MTEETKPYAGYFLIDNRKVFYLNPGETNIGRSADNDLVITDLRVSRTHAKVTFLNGTYLLADMNSSGGTQVNGRPIVQKLLDPGDIITLAREFNMVFHIDSSIIPQNVVEYEPDLAGSKPNISTRYMPDPTEDDLDR